MTQQIMKNSFILGTVIVLLFSLQACLTGGYNKQTQLIQWRTLEQGKIEAGEKGMPVLIDFFTSVSCPRCEYFEQSLYTDPEVAASVNRDFVPVRVNLNYPLTETETALLHTLSPEEECVLAFLDKNGELVTDEMGQPIGSMEKLNKEEYLSYMARALENLP